MALVISLWIGPNGYQGFEQSMAEAKKLSVASTLLSGTFSEDFLDMTFFSETVNPDTGEMQKVFCRTVRATTRKSPSRPKKVSGTPTKKRDSVNSAHGWCHHRGGTGE